MKGILLTVSMCLGTILQNFGQTTATDFTATDCSSGSHTLFTELNSGKVIVLVWVDPCAACISDAIAGYVAAESFATSNPGKVSYWLSDDVGNTACSSLSGWAATNSIGPTNLTVFGNAGNTIDETNYGGTAMPHVVVMGGTDHHIYYNQLNGTDDQVAITNAIALAINATGVAAINSAKSVLKLFPDPARNSVSVTYGLTRDASIKMEVYDVTGKNIESINRGKQNTGVYSFDINFGNNLPAGVYFLKLTSEFESQTIKFILTN